MIIIMKLFQIECGWDLLKYPLTLFMYAHLAVAIAGPYIMQLAYRHGSIIIVAPVSCGISVVYPVVATWVIFSISPHPLQLMSLAAIIGSVLVLAADSSGKKRAAEDQLMRGKELQPPQARGHFSVRRGVGV